MFHMTFIDRNIIDFLQVKKKIHHIIFFHHDQKSTFNVNVHSIESITLDNQSNGNILHLSFRERVKGIFYIEFFYSSSKNKRATMFEH